MPPISHVGSSAIAWSSGTTVSVPMPAGVREGDDLVLLVAVPAAYALVTTTLVDDGWTVVQTIASTNHRVALLRKTAGASIGTDVDLVIDDGMFDLGSTGGAVLLALRGLASETPATTTASDSVATMNHVMPKQDMAISSMWVGLVLITGAAPTPPAWPAVDVPESALPYATHSDGTRSVTVWGRRPEIAVEYTDKVATTGSNRTGVGASIRLDASPAVDAAQGLAYSLLPVGSFGLPSEGI